MKQNIKKISLFGILGLMLSLSGCVVDMSLSNNTIAEKTPTGTEIATINSLGSANPVLQFVNGTGSEDNSKFTIDGDKLKLAFTPSYDNPTDLGDIAGNNTYAIRIKTTGSETLQKNDYSSAFNSYGGFYNAPCTPNSKAFAGITSSGSVYSWGNATYGGDGEPTGTGFVGIYSNLGSFVAIKDDGSLKGWGSASFGGAGTPTDSGYTDVYSTNKAYTARKSDGSLVSWGDSDYGGTGTPTAKDFVKVYSNSRAFAAINLNKEITSWGDADAGGSGAPSGSNFDVIFSTERAFAAVDFDGKITSWGDSSYGGSGAPSDLFSTMSLKLVSSDRAFAAITKEGEIRAWGDSNYGGSGAPSGTDFSELYANSCGFTALKDDGSLVSWGSTDCIGAGAPSGTDFKRVYANKKAFAALKKDGSIKIWGNPAYGGSTAVGGTNYIDIYTTEKAFTARASDGSVVSWGDSGYGGFGTAPVGENFGDVYSTQAAFVGKHSDGTVVTWGNANSGGNYSGSETFTKINSTNYRLVFEKNFVINVTSNKTPLYRLYNKRTGAQLYTRGQTDRNKILSKFHDFEFTDGVPAFYANLTDDGTTPIYRLYNKRTGAQLYTRGEADKNKILAKFSDFEFTDGAPAFYASLTDDGNTPIYRLYNKRTGMQLYARGDDDKNKVLNKFHDFEFTDGAPAFYASLSVIATSNAVNPPKSKNSKAPIVSKFIIEDKKESLQAFYDDKNKLYVYTYGLENVKDILKKYPNFKKVDLDLGDLSKKTNKVFRIHDPSLNINFYIVGKKSNQKFLKNYTDFLNDNAPVMRIK